MSFIQDFFKGLFEPTLQESSSKDFSVFEEKALEITPATTTLTPSVASLTYLYLPDGSIDYQASVSEAAKNSVVGALTSWVGRVFPEAEIKVEELKADDSLQTIPRHPLTTLLNRPNPYYSGKLLWSAVTGSLLLTGNAYLLKVRSATGKVVELWHVAPGQIEPVGGGSTDNFISHYNYRLTPYTSPVRYERTEIIHIRAEQLDPKNPLKGLSPLAAVIREILTDNEALTFAHAVLANMGIPGVIISPADNDAEIDDVAAETILDSFSGLTGKNRGKPAFIGGAIKIDRLSFSPSELDLKTTHYLTETRITAAVGVPAVVLGLVSGLENSTYSNLSNARQMAWENCIIPLQKAIADELETQLLPDFEQAPDFFNIYFDNSKVRILQPDTDAVAKRLDMGFKSGWVKRSEARAALGLPVSPEDDVYISDIKGATFPAPEPNTPPNDTPKGTNN